MKKKVISAKEMRLLLVLISLLILAGSYFLVASRLYTKAQEIQEENIASEAKLRELKNMALTEKKIKEQTAEMKQESQQIIDKMPSLVTQEKAIYIISEIQKSTGVKFLSIGFSMNEVLTENGATEEAAEQDVEQDVEQDEAQGEAAIEEAPVEDETKTVSQTDNLVPHCSILVLQYQASYVQLKDMIDYIVNYNDRMTIESLSASFDTETGNLIGTIGIAMYSVEGTGREYEEPVINGISQGVSNIMRSKNK